VAATATVQDPVAHDDLYGDVREQSEMVQAAAADAPTGVWLVRRALRETAHATDRMRGLTGPVKLSAEQQAVRDRARVLIAGVLDPVVQASIEEKAAGDSHKATALRLAHESHRDRRRGSRAA